jgi:hypothetical protein
LVLQRSRRGHELRLSPADRGLWVWLSRLWGGWRSALIIVKPETVIGWLCSARMQSTRKIAHFEEPPSRGLDRDIGGFHRAAATLLVRTAA